MEEKITRPTDYFGVNLAIVLAGKIVEVHQDFNGKNFIAGVRKNCVDKSLTQRVEIIADHLKIYLPADYKESIIILKSIMGKENHKETGMFKNYYWLMQLSTFQKFRTFGKFLTIVWLATEKNLTSGRFYAERKQIDW